MLISVFSVCAFADETETSKATEPEASEPVASEPAASEPSETPKTGDGMTAVLAILAALSLAGAFALVKKQLKVSIR